VTTFLSNMDLNSLSELKPMTSILLASKAPIS
jgi:hypothetical protein